MTYHILNAVIIAFCARFFYVQGLKDSNFDRVHANLKLQQCLEVIKK
jgi:hypothetical protein